MEFLWNFIILFLNTISNLILIQFYNNIFFKYSFKISLLNEISFYFIFNKTALHIAVEKGNPEFVQLLLAHEELDVNSKLIFKTCFIYVILILIFNKIHK